MRHRICVSSYGSSCCSARVSLPRELGMSLMPLQLYSRESSHLRAAEAKR